MTDDVTYFIDPPSPFASKSKWQAHLAELQALPGKTPQVEAAIKAAEKYISTHY